MTKLNPASQIISDIQNRNKGHLADLQKTIDLLRNQLDEAEKILVAYGAAGAEPRTFEAIAQTVVIAVREAAVIQALARAARESKYLE